MTAVRFLVFFLQVPFAAGEILIFRWKKRCHEQDCITGMSGSMVDRLIAWCQVNLCCNPWRWSNQMPACFPCPNKLAIYHPLAQRSKGPRPRTSSGPIGWWKKGENCSLKETRRTEQQPSFSFKKDPKMNRSTDPKPRFRLGAYLI